MCVWGEESLGMHSFIVNGLVMTGFLLVIVLLITDGDLGMADFVLAAHVLWIGMREDLGICDIFLAGSELECFGGCDGLEMGQWSENSVAHTWCLVQWYQQT